MTLISRPGLAVFDAENASAAQASLVMDKAAALGRPTVRRAYGDWTTSQLAPWKRVVNALGIRPHQQFRYLKGKNTADFALVMDAMDLIHARCVDGFCLVSSDSDLHCPGHPHPGGRAAGLWLRRAAGVAGVCGGL